MKRVLCAWLPDWPLQRLLASRPELSENPIVIHAEAGRRGPCVTACSRFAAERGVVPGLSLAEARALLDPVRGNSPAHCEPLDSAADAAALRELAIELQRFTPRVGIEEPDALLLDIGGCAHLFGDEAGMARQVWRSLHRSGYRSRIVVADTLGAAWGIARFTAERVTIVAPERAAAVLDALPVEALRLPESTRDRLHRLDVRTIGRLRRLPRSSLPARFGTETVSRLDRMFGNAPELLEPIHQEEPLAVRQAFEYPLNDRRTLEAVLRRMLAELVEPIRARREGLLRLLCRLEPERGEAIELTVGVSRPGNVVGHLWELLALRLERAPLPESIAAIQLRALSLAPVETHQQELHERDASRDAAREFDRLLDRLSNRLGSDAVLRSRPIPDAQPERACRYAPAVESRSVGRHPVDRPAETASRRLPRPLRLLADPAAVDVVSSVPEGLPVRIRWRNRTHVVRFVWGPEQIATGWWRAPHVERDYYRVETEEGRRFWLYRERTERRWYLHGTFE